MRTRDHIVRFIGGPLLIAGALLLVRCGSPSEEAQRAKAEVDQDMRELDAQLRADLEKNKSELTEDLRLLKGRIEERIADLDRRLATEKLDAGGRKEIEDARTGMKEQVLRIDAAVSDVGLATRDSWLEVRDGTRKAMNEVNTWFEQQKEKIDRTGDGDPR